MSSIRLETFSDGVFAIAVTLLALQLHKPNLAGVTTAGAVLDALGQQLRQFGFYTLAFLITGGLWIDHHQLLDPWRPMAGGCPGSTCGSCSRCRCCPTG